MEHILQEIHAIIEGSEPTVNGIVESPSFFLSPNTLSNQLQTPACTLTSKKGRTLPGKAVVADTTISEGFESDEGHLDHFHTKPRFNHYTALSELKRINFFFGNMRETDPFTQFEKKTNIFSEAK